MNSMKSFLQNALIATTLAIPMAEGCQKPEENVTVVAPATLEPASRPTAVPSALRDREEEKAGEFVKEMGGMNSSMIESIMGVLGEKCGGVTGKFYGESGIRAGAKRESGFATVGFIELRGNPPTPETQKCMEDILKVARAQIGNAVKNAKCIISYDAPRTPKKGEEKLDQGKYYLPFSVTCDVSGK